VAQLEADVCRAALYVRLSREDEGDGLSQSITNQCLLLREFARRNDLRVWDTYIDDGFSGTNFDRPAFQRMIEDIEAGRVNTVITKDLSRLGRDYIMTGYYMEHYFPEKRVRYISLLDGIDTAVESSANDITPFRAIMNDMYAKDISKKIKSVKRDKQRRGQFIGGKPMYGYRMHPTEKNRIVIDDRAAPVVRRIFAMAQGGMSCRRIAQSLNAEGIPSPSAYAGRPIGAGLWSSERISDMLGNETYIGNMVQGRQAKLSYKSRKCLRLPREAWITVENTHPPLIDRETFDAVRLQMNSRRHTRSRTYDFPLKGLIFCHECGSPLGVINRKNAAGEDRLFFICRGYQRNSSCCTCHSVKEQAVNTAVLDELRQLCAAEEGVLRTVAADVLKEAVQVQEQRRRSLRNRLAGRSAMVEQLYSDRVSGLLSQEDFSQMYRRLQEETASLTAQLHAPQPPSGEERAGELIRQFLEGAGRELLVALIQRVELTQEKEIYIHFRFRDPEALS